MVLWHHPRLLYKCTATDNLSYTAQPVDINPLRGRHRAGAVANLADVVLAQLHVAVELGMFNVLRDVVSVLICCDEQDTVIDSKCLHKHAKSR